MPDKESQSSSPIDEQRFVQVYEQLLPRLYTYIRSRGLSLGVDAEDIAQQVFIDLLDRLRNGKIEIDDERLNAYVFRLAQMRIKEHYRRVMRAKQREEQTSIEGLAAETPDPLAESLSNELKKHLEDAVSKIEIQATEPRATGATQLSVFVDPGDAPAELIAELYASLDALYRSCGGSGLRVSREERRTFVGELL